MVLKTSYVVLKKTIFSEKAYSKFFLKNFKLLLLNFKVVVICNFHRLYSICTISKIVFICENSFSVLDLEIAPAGHKFGRIIARGTGLGGYSITSSREVGGSRRHDAFQFVVFSLLSISIRQATIKLQDMIGRIYYLDPFLFPSLRELCLRGTPSCIWNCLTKHVDFFP